jgi:Holliday junction resolvase
MSKYSQGAQVEREVRDDLYLLGAVLVMKAGGSKVTYPKWWTKALLRPKVDLIALMNPYGNQLVPWLVQVKKKGRITKAERKDLLEFSQTYSCECYLARKVRGKIEYERL